MEKINHLNFLDTLLPLAFVIFIICAGVIFLNLHFQKNLSQQRLKEEALKNIYQHDLLRSGIQAQEEERKRIARDLHDELGAILSIMRMHLMVLEQQSTGESQRLQGGLQNVRQLSETVMASIRSISHLLMPPQLEAFGLLTTLESIIQQINTTEKIAIELSSDGHLDDLPWMVSIGLFRIVMELINNTIKHAGASGITIGILRNDDHIICNYRDDGKGLPKEMIKKGLGHKSIEGRVTALAGKLEMGNGRTGGFYAVIQLSLNAV